MLDPVPPRADVDQELVLVERQPAEERRLRAHDAAQRLEVLLEVALAADDEMDARAALDEGVPRQRRRGERRRVDEMVVIARMKNAAVVARQLRLDPPVARRRDREPRRLPPQRVDAHKEVGAVEVRLLVVEEARSRIDDAGVVAVRDRDLLPHPRRRPPLRLSDLAQVRAPLPHVRRIVLNEVAPRPPRRQPEQRIILGRREAQGHIEEVIVRICPGDRVEQVVKRNSGRAGRLTAVLLTIEAEVDEKGNIRPKEPVSLPPGSRVLITVLEAEPTETALLSEAALSADWERPEEEAAWSHLSRD